MREVILQAFDAIAISTSLEILNVEYDPAFEFYDFDDHLKRAVSLNTSLNDIRIDTDHWLRDVLDIVMSTLNLKALTMRHDIFRGGSIRTSIENITAMAQVLRMDMKSLSLTFEGGFNMDSDQGAAFAAAFQGNQTISALILRALSFVKALLRDPSLEAIVFDENGFDDDSAVSIFRTLCHAPLKVLSLAGSRGLDLISLNCCTRIVRTLKENEHSFTKLDLFPASQYSLWQNKIWLEILWQLSNNRLQVEKDTWVDRFLRQDAYTQELLFRTGLEKANKMDNEQFSKAPNMIFNLIKAVFLI